MLFYRIIGAVMLVLSGVAGAYYMNRAASAALAQVEAHVSFLRYVRLQVECFALPISEILRKCDRELLLGCGYRRDLVPKNLADFLAGIEHWDPECEGIMRSFSVEFGKGYRDEQVRSCEYHAELLEARREALSARLPERKKLYSTLCVTGALAVVIILL